MTSSAERAHFDELFEQAFERLPEDVHELLEEVPIVVEDEPSRELLEELGIEARPGEADLCGLHSAIPLTERDTFEGVIFPGPIYVFRGPILRLAGYDPKQIEKQIWITLLHEIGHHFGFSEERLHDLGYE